MAKTTQYYYVIKKKGTKEILRSGIVLATDQERAKEKLARTNQCETTQVKITRKVYTYVGRDF